eukprot:gene8845-8936_t
MRDIEVRAVPRRLLGALGLLALAGRRSEAAPLSIGELYGAVTAEGLQLSPAGKALVGRKITLKGYMAPPLKPESDFFVLTRYPMSTCPFCSNAADWPADIVVVNLGRNAEMLGAAYAIEVSGVLEVGAKMDPNTGFVSLVRVVEADWRRV